ncbi:MAG: hypothetical protein ABIS59_00270 [Candidatus Saccharibacteria bacterium]
MTNSISPILLKHYRGPEAELSSDEFYRELAAKYEEAWRVYEPRIIEGLISVLNVHFFLPVIDATLAPMVSCFSTPLTLNYKYEPDQFIDLLTHELIHILISDNQEGIVFSRAVKAQWSDVEMLVIWHIMVHALLKYVYLDILDQPSRLQRDVDAHTEAPAYKLAWEIVEDFGYREIIDLMLTDKNTE